MKIYTPEEFAARLGDMPVRTVVDQCAKREIPGARKIAGRWRIPEWGLQELIDQTMSGRAIAPDGVKITPDAEVARLLGLDSEPTTTFVYFVQCIQAMAVKIGFATQVESRIRSIRVDCPLELRTLLVVHGSRSTERELHSRFWGQRIRGEWFRMDGALLETVRRVRSNVTMATIDEWRRLGARRGAH